jgi:hypothetical protein
MRESPRNRVAETIARLSPKHRQFLILGIGVSAFTLLVFGGAALWDQPAPRGGCSKRTPATAADQRPRARRPIRATSG